MDEEKEEVEEEDEDMTDIAIMVQTFKQEVSDLKVIHFIYSLETNI